MGEGGLPGSWNGSLGNMPCYPRSPLPQAAHTSRCPVSRCRQTVSELGSSPLSTQGKAAPLDVPWTHGKDESRLSQVI